MELDTLLMTPGPVTLDSSVLLAGAMPLKHHRTKDFEPIYSDCVRLLKKFFYTKQSLYLTTSSGTGGMETAIANLFHEGETILTVETGFFGERFTKIAQSFKLNPIPLKCEDGKGVRVEQIKEMLDKHPEIVGVTVTFNETSTGLVNDLESIGELLHERDVLFITDGVSGIGALPFKMDDWHVDVAVSASQKGFLAPPAVGIIALSEKAMKKVKEVDCHGFYFNLKYYIANQELDIPSYPWTPAISVMLSLHEALKKIDRIGIDNFHAHYAKLGKALRSAIKALGLELFTEESSASNVLTIFKMPDGINPADVVAEIRNRYSVLIAGGQGKLASSYLRITTIGSIGERELIGTIGLLEMVLKKKGYLKDVGAGTRALMNSFIESEQ